MLKVTIAELCRHLRQNQTPSEILLWKELRAKRFAGYKFRRQHPIVFEGEQGKQRFFIPDFYCHEKKLIIELDGKVHEFQKEYDENRDLVLSQLGLQTIRILNEELRHNMGEVMHRILLALESS